MVFTVGIIHSRRVASRMLGRGRRRHTAAVSVVTRRLELTLEIPRLASTISFDETFGKIVPLAANAKSQSRKSFSRLQFELLKITQMLP